MLGMALAPIRGPGASGSTHLTNFDGDKKTWLVWQVLEGTPFSTESPWRAT